MGPQSFEYSHAYLIGYETIHPPYVNIFGWSDYTWVMVAGIVDLIFDAGWVAIGEVLGSDLVPKWFSYSAVIMLASDFYILNLVNSP